MLEYIWNKYLADLTIKKDDMKKKYTYIKMHVCKETTQVDINIVIDQIFY